MRPLKTVRRFDCQPLAARVLSVPNLSPSRQRWESSTESAGPLCFAPEMPFAKLDSALIHSTVWREPHTTRIVWITLLAMKNRHGEVYSSVPGLADVARVTVAECRTALATLLAPDEDSRHSNDDGRRLLPIEGGWFVINHDKFQKLDNGDDRAAKAAARAKRYRERKRAEHGELGSALEERGVTLRHAASRPVTLRHAPSRPICHADADADADAEAGSSRSSLAGKDSKQLPPQAAARNGRATWLTPFVAIWDTAYGKGSGTDIAPRMARALSPLVKRHGAEKVQRQLRHYVGQVELRYANPQSFAQKFSAWKPAPAQPGTADYEAEARRIGREEFARQERARAKR